MMKKIVTIFLIFQLLISTYTPAKTQEKERSGIEKAGLAYSSPVKRSEEGMPIGNGTMGTLVWTTPRTLHYQVNRVDIFGNNSASDNFYERNTDYCGGAAFIDIQAGLAGDEVFSGGSFHQELSCVDGEVTVKGNGMVTRSTLWQENDVLAVAIEDQRNDPEAIAASLRMLRPPLVKKGDHSATSKISLVGDRILLTQIFEEDGYYCSSAVMLCIDGRNATSQMVNESEARLVVRSEKGKLTLFAASAASFDRSENLQEKVSSLIDQALAKGYDNIYSANRKWWDSFWDRGYVRLQSDDGKASIIEEHYNYYLYIMASSSRGKLPPKFNGMLWTTAGDARKWGNLFWGANQGCLYNGLFPTNRMELLDPLFRMYTGMYPSLRKAAEQQWGSQGIYVPETVAFDGLAELPEEVAAEMRELYLGRKPWSERSDAFFRYGGTKMPFLSRWNWKKDEGWKDGRWNYSDKGGGAFGHVTHIFSRGAKIAYQYWMKYEYTRDREWLRTSAYPMLRGMAEFYRNFPNVRKEADGKYHIRLVNDNESVWGGHNTVEEISSMMGIFPAAIRASELLGTDPGLRELWKEFMANLSPLPLNSDYPDKFKKGDQVIFARSLLPVLQGDGSRTPDPNTMPVWFFDLCNLNGSRPELTKIAQATYDSYFKEGITEKSPMYVLSRLPATGTLMGRKEAMKYLVPNQILPKETEFLSNRMDLREGYQTASVQRLGRAAEALHNALVQSNPPWPGEEPVIRLFPAWPDDWDASFKLLCRGNFLVSSSFKNGKTEFVGILSQSGQSCTIENPWKGQSATLYRNRGKTGRLRGAIFRIDTSPHENILIQPD